MLTIDGEFSFDLEKLKSHVTLLEEDKGKLMIKIQEL